MAVLLVDKVVSALPGILTPNTIYAVRVGVGFDLYISDTTGSVAHRINSDGIPIHVGTTPPASPSEGDLWLDTGATAGGIDPAFETQLNNMLAEVAAARGDRSALGLRIATISNFASPNAGGNVVGSFYDNSFQGTNASTLASAANRISLAPFYTSAPLYVDQIGVAVSTAGAGAARCLIYDSDADGWPDNLLLSPDILDTGTTGYRYADMGFQFDTGRQYWLGVHTAGTPTLRSINTSSAVNLGVNGNSGTNYFTVLRRTVTYASGAPSVWGFLSSDRVAGVTPFSIRMRAAALP